MAVYDAEGNQLFAVYDAEGNALSKAYDAEGNLIFQMGDVPWIDEITVEKKRDESASTNYYLIRIPQTRLNGSKQFPFVYAPNGSGAGAQSTLDMNLEKGFEMAINAGLFSTGNYPIGLTIQNSTVFQEEASTSTLHPLTINSSGMLGYTDKNKSGTELVNEGIVSAVDGFCPIVIDHSAVDSSWYTSVSHYNQNAQRQIIGQYDNGDYAIVTCEGRNFDNSTGWTFTQAIAKCISEGLKFAYMLDGGGSTETVIGDEQLNVIYEGTTGRVVPTYIVFNGTDSFFVPSEQET